MRYFIWIPVFILQFSLRTAYGQKPLIVEKTLFLPLSHEQLAKKISREEKGQRVYFPQYRYLDSIDIYKITYMSDGLKVNGYLVRPKAKGKFPAVVYNRGGNRDFGALNDFKAVFILARIASWGYVVGASQYRGNMGGEGREEFGGSDVRDVLNMADALSSLSYVDKDKMGIYGWSRGGMMTYLALTRTCRFKAAIVGAGLSDLWKWMETRPDTIESVYGENIPHYATRTSYVLNERSAIKKVDQICKTTPILILHGSADWRVSPLMALDMAQALTKSKIPYRLIIFEGGDHALSEYREEVDKAVRSWLDKYLVRGVSLPNLNPHGR